MLNIISCCLVPKLRLFWDSMDQLSGFLCPWDFPGKYTGAGCHFLLWESNPGIKLASPALAGGFFFIDPPGESLFLMAAAAQSLQSCPTLCEPMDCKLPGSSVHGILQNPRVPESVPCPPPGDLPKPGGRLGSPALQAYC